jgi:hypothetical protein
MADTNFTDEDPIFAKALEAMGHVMGMDLIEMGVPMPVFIPRNLSEKQMAELLEIEAKRATEYNTAVLADMKELFGTDFATMEEVKARLMVAAEAGLAAKVYDEDLGEYIGPRPMFAGREHEVEFEDVGVEDLGHEPMSPDDTDIKIGGTSSD